MPMLEAKTLVPPSNLPERDLLKLSDMALPAEIAADTRTS